MVGTLGELRFVSSMSEIKDELAAQGVLVVTVKRALRGRLAEGIDEAIEESLCAKGAARGALTLDALSDQVFRARRLGFERLAICLECLDQAAAPIGILDGLDAFHLSSLARQTRDRPILVLIPETDAKLHAYSASTSLNALLSPPIESEEEFEWEHACEPPVEEEPTFSEMVAAMMVDDAESVAESVARAVSEAIAEVPAHADARMQPAASTMPAPVSEPGIEESVWRPWAKALRDARGPQTLAVFERIFTESYLPLANAVASGLSHAEAVGSVDEFRRSFARAYTDAVPMFPLTSKRPKMVLDAHDVAGRLARRHGARTTQLLLVSGMRWDIGARVRESLSTLLAGRGSVVAETSLFASLPTTTWRQLDGIARGLESLRNPAEPQSDDPVRGRTSEIVRRVRVGARDVYKLDWVDAAVRATSSGIMDDLPAIAAACADLVLKHALTLPPRTLLFVFGDHGFCVDASGRISWGGASPEEVIVSAFGVLVGELH